MVSYKHTQISYLMLGITLAVLVSFTWLQITARAEPPSYNSGTNFAVTATMFLIVVTLASFSTLHVLIDEQYVRIRFGLGIFRKKFALDDIVSVKRVQNRWYYGWGIRLWLWPRMWMYNVSGFDAIELRMKNGNVYRIGTDTPDALKAAITHAMPH